MKIETSLLPSEDRISVVLIRFIPQDDSEREQIVRAKEALSGTNAIVATPEIEHEKVLSLIFHAKKNQEKTA